MYLYIKGSLEVKTKGYIVRSKNKRVYSSRM